VMSSQASGKGFGSIAAEPTAEGLVVPDGAMVFTALLNESGEVTFCNGGKYLSTQSTGGNLVLSDAEDEYTRWKLEAVTGAENTYTITNAKAVGNNRAQAIEVYREVYTTYGISANKDIYHFQMYLMGQGQRPVAVDSAITANVAQWAGTADYSAITENKIPGDRYTTNDMADAASTYQAVVSGAAVQPYSVVSGGTNQGLKNYYMGGAGLGSGTNDYLEFATTSLGFGQMQLSFRLRASGSATSGVQLQYSTDGSHYENFTTGTYAYSYTDYGNSTTGTPKSGNGEITDGFAKTNYVKGIVGKYVEFTFDVPSEASNAEKLYIRMVPSNTRATTTATNTAVSNKGVIRMDSVLLTGHPVVATNQVGYISADVASGQIPANTKVTLSTATEGATIYYSMDRGQTFQVYSEENQPVVTEFPAAIVTYGTKEGLKKSATAIYQYTQSKVQTVQANPTTPGDLTAS